MIKRYHPGIYLKEALEAMDMTAKEFSIRTGISERSLSSFMAGKTGISFELASKLGSFFRKLPKCLDQPSNFLRHLSGRRKSQDGSG